MQQNGASSVITKRPAQICQIPATMQRGENEIQHQNPKKTATVKVKSKFYNFFRIWPDRWFVTWVTYRHHRLYPRLCQRIASTKEHHFEAPRLRHLLQAPCWRKSFALLRPSWKISVFKAQDLVLFTWLHWWHYSQQSRRKSAFPDCPEEIARLSN